MVRISNHNLRILRTTGSFLLGRLSADGAGGFLPNVLSMRNQHATRDHVPSAAGRGKMPCRHDGLKPGTPAYAKCREDIKNRRAMQDMAMRIGMQNQQWTTQQMSTRAMMGTESAQASFTRG